MFRMLLIVRRLSIYKSHIISCGPNHCALFALAVKSAALARSLAARLSRVSLLQILYFFAHCARRGWLAFIRCTPLGRRALWGRITAYALDFPTYLSDWVAACIAS